MIYQTTCDLFHPETMDIIYPANSLVDIDQLAHTLYPLGFDNVPLVDSTGNEIMLLLSC